MKSLRRYRRRLTRCYELNWIAMLNEPGAENFRLVHGYTRFGIDHSWIEIGDGRIYEADLDRYSTAAEFEAENEPVVERRYTHQQAMLLGSETGNYGPWHEPEHRRPRFATAADRLRAARLERALEQQR